jgi:hypothetical protein
VTAWSTEYRWLVLLAITVNVTGLIVLTQTLAQICDIQIQYEQCSKSLRYSSYTQTTDNLSSNLSTNNLNPQDLNLEVLSMAQATTLRHAMPLKRSRTNSI